MYKLVFVFSLGLYATIVYVGLPLHIAFLASGASTGFIALFLVQFDLL